VQRVTSAMKITWSPAACWLRLWHSNTAAQPAKYTLNGKTVRPLGAENDKAFELINALDASQREAAIIGSVFRDVVLGPGRDGKQLAPEGVKVSTFNAAQKAQLLAVIREWVGITSDAAAKVKMAEIEAKRAKEVAAAEAAASAATAAAKEKEVTPNLMFMIKDKFSIV
jgi:hypothetical protein